MTIQRVDATQKRPPLWRNATVLKWAAQIFVLVGLVALALFLGGLAAENFRASGREFSWRFLTDPLGFRISEGIYTEPESGLQAIATGIVNMLRVTASGIVAATLLGTIIGVSRLSSNWLISKLATFYVETVRNIPLLVQIVFWLFVATLLFPQITPDTDGPIDGVLIVTRQGVSVIWPFPTATFWQWFVIAAIGALAGWLVHRNRTALRERTGKDTRANTFAFITFLAIAILGFLIHPVAGAVGWVFEAIGAVLGAIPQFAFQVFLAALAVYFAYRYIRTFLDSRRTPAGLAKLTDDDWFSLIFAGLVGVVGAAVFLVVSGIAGVALDVLTVVIDFAASKFEWMRTGAPFQIGRPEVVVPGNFARLADTGMTITPSFFAIWVGVTLYTTAFIAEIVRGGVLAVAKGQTEAGLALGLRRGQLLRLIVLPQAFRIILPPMGNQYLNLAKNTSLGIAVGYADIVAVGSTIQNQTGATIQVILIWMAFYLSVSLFISAIVNWYNRKTALVER